MRIASHRHLKFCAEFLEPRLLLAGAVVDIPSSLPSDLPPEYSPFEFNGSFVGPINNPVRHMAPGTSAALTIQNAEMLARGVAYDNHNPGDVITYPGLQGGYVVDARWSNASGLYAMGLRSDFGPCLIFRGTEFSIMQPEDILADAHPTGIGYTQFASAWTGILQWLDAQKEAVDIVGHSLGGALVQWAAAAWTSRAWTHDAVVVDHVYTFNAPGITNNSIINPNLVTYADKFVPKRALKVTHTIPLGDMVSMAGEKYIPGDVITAKWSNPGFGGLYHKHTRPVFVNSIVGGGTKAPDLVLGSITHQQLSAFAYLHNDREYLEVIRSVQLISAAVGTITNVAVPGTGLLFQVIPLMLLTRGTTEVGRKVAGAVIHALKSLVQTTITGVNMVNTLVGSIKPIWKSAAFTFNRDFTMTKLPAGPQFTGKLEYEFTLPELVLDLPWYMGGQITVVKALNVLEASATGIAGPDRLQFDASINVLSGLATGNANIALFFQSGRARVSGNLSMMDGFVTSSGATWIDSNLNISAAGTGQVRIPNGAPAFAGRTLSSGRMSLRFTNNGTSADDYLMGYGTLGPIKAGLQVFFNGVVKKIGAAKLIPFLRPPGDGVSGGSFTVPPDKEWVVLQTNWENDSPSAEIRLINPLGQVITEADIAADPNMQIFEEMSDGKQRAVYIANPMPGTWNIDVVDPTGLGQVTYDGLADVPLVSADFVSVTGGNLRTPVEIELDVTDPSNTTLVDLYYDEDGDGEDGTLIAADLSPTAGTLNYSWDVSEVPAGSYRIYAVAQNEEGLPVTVYSDDTVTITEGPPTLTDSEFLFEAFQAINLDFSQDVFASMAVEDFVLENLTTSTPIPPAELELTFAEYSNVATISYTTGLLPNGNYRLTAPASAITNSDGTPLAADIDFGFYVLAGDANRDRTVDQLDLDILTANFGMEGAVFSDGDFNYDGVVDQLDEDIYYDNEGTTIPEPPPAGGGGSRGSDGRPGSQAPPPADPFGAPMRWGGPGTGGTTFGGSGFTTLATRAPLRFGDLPIGLGEDGDGEAVLN